MFTALAEPDAPDCPDERYRSLPSTNAAMSEILNGLCERPYVFHRCQTCRLSQQPFGQRFGHHLLHLSRNNNRHLSDISNRPDRVVNNSSRRGSVVRSFKVDDRKHLSARHIVMRRLGRALPSFSLVVTAGNWSDTVVNRALDVRLVVCGVVGRAEYVTVHCTCWLTQ